MPGAPGGQQDPEAGVGRPQALLGVDDLDRDDDREADQRQRLADQQRAHRAGSRARTRARRRSARATACGPRARARAGRLATARTIAISANEAASTSRATDTPNAAISPPASAAPNTEEAANPRFISALPSVSRSLGCSSTADGAARQAAAGDRQRPVDRAEREHQREEEAVPVGQEGQRDEYERLDARTAPAASCAAPKRSRCAVRPVASSAGRNFANRKNPAVGATDSVGHRPGSRARRRRSSRRGH